jgi:hypothetical protein
MNYRQRQRGVYGTPQEATAEGAEEGDPDFNRWLAGKNRAIGGLGRSRSPRRRQSVRPAKVATGYGGRFSRSF